jgi:uncharacterized protein
MVLLLITFLSEFLGTLVTFGSSSFFVPLIYPIYGMSATLALVSLLHVTSNFLKIFAFKQGISWKIIVYFGIPAILLTSLGAYLSAFVPNNLFKLILGIVVILGVILEIFAEKLKFIMSRKLYIVGGSISGFVTGLVGTGGAIRGIFLLMLNIDKNAMIASSAFVDFWEDLIRLIIYWRNGYFTAELWSQWYLLLIGSIAGVFLARKVVNKLSNKWFRIIVMVSLSGLALYYIAGFFWKI